jgi:DNA polymerase II large subunit
MKTMDGEMSRDIAASPAMRAYFQQLQQGIDNCYQLANAAREKGYDPELSVEIPQALDLAARVEQLVGPPGIAPKIRQATQKIGNRELVSLEIARMIADRKTYQFNTIEQALDQAIRTGLAILTEGVLVAPLEGIAEVRVGRNNDGTTYVDLYFSGPIRSAGGTGQAMSVLIADVVRRDLGIDRYVATPGEIERLKEEIPLYKRVQHLQYLPSVDEIDLIMKNCPICINGEGTEDEEVAGYRDLPRISTNRLRGGACLVIAEGLCLKAPKIYKHIKKMKLPGWEFLEPFVNRGVEPTKENGEIPAIPPSSKYIGEVIAGRPVLSHPSRKGGFRLRYGRARTAGLASTAINPATMFILDSFITVGTQMKTERPGKGTIGTPCDHIEGPIVLLQNGDLIQINDVKDIRNDVKKIIDVGEILIPFGEFIENNSYLPDASYTYEWWIQELQTKLDCIPPTNTTSDIAQADCTTQQKINDDLKRPIDMIHPTPTDAFILAEQYHIPLHPDYNLFWHDLLANDIVTLRTTILEHGKYTTGENQTLSLPNTPEIKNILIELGALHTQREGTLQLDHYAYPLIRCCGLSLKDTTIETTDRCRPPASGESTLDYISTLAGVRIRARGPFRIGTRMGRPEKASPRKMRPPPHVLFPLGDYGGNQRLVKNAAENVTIEVEAGKRRCPNCNTITFRLVCSSCGTHTEVLEGKLEKQQINLSEELERAQKNVKEHTLPEIIKGVIGTISKHKTPEPLEKGILRAKHNVYVFKDGTIRFDMTDAPLTHFKPKEIGVPLKRLRELGYTKDYLGNTLENEEQICELKVQDVIVSTACAEYFIQVSKFIDDLLTKFYGVDRFYKIKKIQELTGHLVVGLAPHTSAGALGRIIGFTSAQVCFMHPFFHATKRRNCLAPETSIYLANTSQPTLMSLQELYAYSPDKETVVDSFGTTEKVLTDINTFSCNPQSGRIEIQKVLSVLRTPAPRYLVKVTLKSGRTFTSSPAHRIIVWKNGTFKTKKIIEVNPDDFLLVSQQLQPNDRDINEIDLLSEFLKKNVNDVMVRGIETFTRQCVEDLGGLDATVKLLQFNKKTFSNYLYRDSIPLPILISLLRLCHRNLQMIPKKCWLGVKRDDTKIPRMIPVNSSLLRLCGYYLAEGHARQTRKLCYQISFAATEQEIRSDIVSCIRDVFQVRTCQDDHGITVSNRLIYDFVINFLRIGSNAKNKKIPLQFMGLPTIKIKELLRGYFAGDGSVEKNRLHVTCSSVNRKLLQDIGFQLLRFGVFYRIKEEKNKPAGGIAKIFYDKKNLSPVFDIYYLSIRSLYARRFAEHIGFSLQRKQHALESVLGKERKPRVNLVGDFILDSIKSITSVLCDSDFLYDVKVEGVHNFLINDALLSSNCDGDEDGLMLLMDALLNFSHAYIPDKRGGKMDLPLILTTRLDPSEVDKEAHNLDTLARYPLEFYEATLRHEHSKNLESMMGLVASRLGTELQYEQFGFTHDTTDISEGPKESLYKTLKSMMEKMNVQLSLAAKIRAVDEADVAYKVIERHFLPDILGNLRAFSKQSVRCPLCNTTYRRVPLQGVCTKCNGKLTLTVHEMSVKKYLTISKEIAEKYNLPVYARQRIALVEKSIDSMFVSDKVKNTKLSDFF